MKIILYISLFFITYTTYAQVLITNFVNPQTTTPNYISYKGMVNNKVIFAAFTPETGYELWVSDGTNEGTKILSDLAKGSNSTYFSRFVAFRNYLYLDNSWKTDGQTITKNYSLPGIISVIDDKPLLQRTINNPFPSYPVTPYDSYKLLIVNASNDTTSLSDQPIFSHKQINNLLFFNTYSHKDSVWTFNRYYNGRIEKIHQEKLRQMPVTMDFYSNQGYFYFKVYLRAIDYDSRTGNKSIQSLIRIEDDLSKGYQIKKFDGSLSFYKDEQEQKMYLFHLNDSLQLFELGSPATMKPKNQVKIEPIGYAGGYFSINHNADKISYIKATGTHSENNYLYLFEHNLTNNTVRQSENLIKIFSRTLSNYEVKFLKENQYEISSNSSVSRIRKRGIYDLATNEWKELPIILKADTILLQNKRIVLSDTTVGVLNNSGIDELLTKKKYFLKYNSIQYFAKLKDKLLFFIKPQYKNYLELWLSNGEKGGNKFLTTIEGEYFAETFEINNQFFIITYAGSYPNGIFRFFKTDGTAEGTKLAFSTNEKGQRFENEKQVIYRIPEYSGQNYLLVFENENIKRIDVSKINNLELYQTNTQTFAVVRGNNENDLYLINDGTLILVETAISRFISHKNRIYFQKDFQSYYFEDNKITLVSKENIFYQQILGDKLIFFKKSDLSKTETAYTFIINDLTTNKEDIRFEQSFPKDLANYNVFQIKNAVIISMAEKLIIVKGSQKLEVQLPSKQNGGIQAFANGFLIYNPTLLYYDLDDNSLTVLSIIGFRETQFMGNKLLIIENPNSDQRQLLVFDTSVKKIYIQPQNLLYSMRVLKNGIINRFDKKYHYWVFENEQFVEKYEFGYPENIPLNWENIDNRYYIPYYKESTGFELAEIGRDSLLYFPEIIKGVEGIDLNRVFHFNNQVYVIAFTNTYGLQVWKMGEIKAEQKVVLAEETKAEGFLVTVYPNPTTDLINIESSQPFHVSLISPNGAVVKQIYLEHSQILDMQNLPTGVYLLRFENKKQLFSKKIVKF